MDSNLLGILRCPFCGMRLQLEQSSLLEIQNGEVVTGIVYCQCCAYPIVAGIPYIRTGTAATTAMDLLGDGESEQALYTLLGLHESKQRQFASLLSGDPAATFRNALEILSPDAEGLYFLYRFSDPTFLCSQAVLRAIGQDRRCVAGRILDLCGGTGHLTRSLCELAAANEVILVDIAFWKIWLAKRFIAPRSQPVCCDANGPLPFAKDTFSLVVCSDAFHYIWYRRMLACEMARLVGDAGTIVLPHLHNALCQDENYSAGMPLTPAGYRDLFEGFDTRLFKESAVLSGLVNRRPVDLSADYADDELTQEMNLTLIATRLEDLFHVYERSDEEQTASRLSINPLYKLAWDGESSLLKREFPSPEYELEYGDCKLYLPESVKLKAGDLEHIEQQRHAGELKELAVSYVLLDLPGDYV